MDLHRLLRQKRLLHIQKTGEKMNATNILIITSLWFGFIALLFFLREMKRLWKKQVELNKLLLEMIEIKAKRGKQK